MCCLPWCCWTEQHLWAPAVPLCFAVCGELCCWKVPALTVLLWLSPHASGTVLPAPAAGCKFGQTSLLTCPSTCRVTVCPGWTEGWGHVPGLRVSADTQGQD